MKNDELKSCLWGNAKSCDDDHNCECPRHQPETPSGDMPDEWLDKLETDLHVDGISADDAQKLIDIARAYLANAPAQDVDVKHISELTDDEFELIMSSEISKPTTDEKRVMDLMAGALRECLAIVKLQNGNIYEDINKIIINAEKTFTEYKRLKGTK